MAHLVEGGDQALLLAHHARLLLGAGDHAHDPLLELVLADLALACSRRQQRRLLDQVRPDGAPGWLSRFDSSARGKRGVWPASASMSMTWASGLPRVCTSRIFARP